MMIGVGRVVIDYYQNDSLKLKRKHLEALCKDLRKEFNLSALEVEDFDDPERCVVGYAAVIPTSWKHQSAQSFINKIGERIDETCFARVISEDSELLNFESRS